MLNCYSFFTCFRDCLNIANMKSRFFFLSSSSQVKILINWLARWQIIFGLTGNYLNMLNIFLPLGDWI